MKCPKCGKPARARGAKFCPYCGEPLGQVPERDLAGYTRAQFFSCIGDDEFIEAWPIVREMSAKEALAWLRVRPDARYVYKFYGTWKSNGYSRSRIVHREFIKRHVVGEGGRVEPRKYKLAVNDLWNVGKTAFWTKEECEAAIKEELEKC